MTSARINTCILKACLALRRFGLGSIVVCAISIIGAALWLVIIPYLHAQSTSRQHAVDHAMQTLLTAERSTPAMQRPIAEERLANFYKVTAEKYRAEQQVKALFAIAEETGLTLSQAEYRTAFDKASRVHAYQIVLPVKGPYGAIRQFCSKTLLKMPFASLDELSFKRESIANPKLEARLRFTMYLVDVPPPKADEASTAEKGQS